MAKSELARWPNEESGTVLAVDVVAVAVDDVVLEESVEDVDVVEAVAMLARGLKVTGTFRAVGAIAADICRLKTLLASITRISTITSDFGLSRSWITFSASAILSASPRATIANWLEYGKTFWRSATARTTLMISCISCGEITLDR